MKLLFCDTFSQEPADGSVFSSWAAINFPVPVVLEEIRILSRGYCLHDQLANEGQIGSTSPAQFRIDFFASDSNNDSCSAFENLCTLEYKESSQTSVLPPLPFVTDKLLCSGWYQRVTIAVFGAEASDSVAVKAIRERREYGSRNRALLPTPKEPPRHTDVPRLPDKVDDNLQKFTKVHSSSVTPPINPQTDPQPHEFEHNKSGEGAAFKGNFSNRPPEIRPYTDRQPIDLQYQKNRGDFYNKRPPALLPTPGSNEVRDSQRGNKYQYERLDRSLRRSSQNDVGDWHHEQRRTSRQEHDGRNAEVANDETMEQDRSLLHQYDTEQRTDEEWMDDAEYEEISDDDIMDEDAAANMEAILAEDMLLPSSMMNFNPFDMMAYPLTYYKPPEVTESEILRHKVLDQIESGEDTASDQAVKEMQKGISELQQLIDLAKSMCLSLEEDQNMGQTCGIEIVPGKEAEWVSCIEKMLPKLKGSLSCLDLSNTVDIDYVAILVSYSIYCLRLNSPLAKILGVNVRALKSGLSLALELLHTSVETAEQLVQHGLLDAVFSLLETSHIASSVKISAIHVLDAVTNWPLMMHYFMYGHGDNNIDFKTDYARAVEMALVSQAARVAAALAQLVQKAHIYECMVYIKTATHAIVSSKIPAEYAYVSEEENDEADEIFSAHDEADMGVVPSVAGYEVVEDSSIPEDETPSKQSTGLGDHDNLRIIQQSGHRRVFGEASGSEDNADSGLKNSFESVLVENTTPLESVFSLEDVNVTNEVISKLAKSLDEISVAFRNPSASIGQLHIKAFPVKSSQPLKQDPNLCDVTLFRMSEFTGLLPSIQALMTLPFVSGFKSLFDSCCGFLEQLMSNAKQLLHVCSNSDSLIHVVHHLLKSSQNLDVEIPGTPGNFALKLAIHIQCIQSLDHISSLLEQDITDEEDEELVHALRVLYSVTYLPLGKQCLARILAMDDFVTSMVPCLLYPAKVSDVADCKPESVERTSTKDSEDQKSESDSKIVESSDKNDEKKPEIIYHRSAVNHYAASIVLNTLIKSESVAYVLKHKSIFKKTCLARTHSIPKSDALANWLHPLKSTVESEQYDLGKLLVYLKTESEQMEWKTFPDIGPKVCMGLRMLCHACNTDKTQQGSANLRLRMKDMFSADGLNILLTVIEKLHTCLVHVCHGLRAMSIGLPVTLFNTLISVARSSVKLVALMHDQLFTAGIDGKCVNGDRFIKAVVPLYSDLYILARPVDTILLDDITQIFVSAVSQFFEHKSCFDQSDGILCELLKHAESQCDNFVPTLTLLSQLLPLPLPIVSPEKPDGDSASSVLKLSSMWSTCIMPHIDRLMSLLLPLSASKCRPLLDVTVALTQQVMDLSPALAHEVVRKYIEEIAPLLVNTTVTLEDGSEANDEQIAGEKELMLSPEQITTIAVFAEIATLPAAKSATISALYNEGDGILDLWQYASSDLCPDDAVAATLLLATVLVDSDIALLPSFDDDLKSLSTYVPSTLHLRQITSLAIQQLISQSDLVVARALLVILRVVDQRQALAFIRNGLSKSDTHLLKCIENINEKFDPKNSQSVDVAINLIALLSDMIEPESIDMPEADCCRPCLTITQLSTLLQWNDNPQHPLRVFESKVNQLCSFDDESCDGALDKLAVLRQSLVVVENGAGEITIVQEPDLPAPPPLADQFAGRPVFVLGTDDTILESRLAITCPEFCPASEEPKTSEFVRCDLVSTAVEFCPGYDLAEQLSKLAKSSDFLCEALDSDSSRSRRQPKVETYSSNHGKTLTYMKRSHGLLSQPRPGRGRGNVHNRPFDLFRHRKQNTSRPPSMHVDDFMAADEEQLKQQKDDGGIFKSPQPPSVSTPPSNRRQMSQPFKREFTQKSRGGRGARGIPRAPRGSFSNSNLNQGKFRPPVRGRSQERYRGTGTTRLSSRLSYSPREGFKTNKTENPSWGVSNRNFTQAGGSQYRGRGTKFAKYPRAPPSPFGSSRGGGKQWQNSPFPRRGRGYGKPRGKHIRSFTR
uniref:Protein virilizer homolog n=1 Tax=Phallusia mammillata TaxID=59560 RepID=A0A6F9DF22_9ASCI|nr:protein virilizer homolog [Phallusia mammillata]